MNVVPTIEKIKKRQLEWLYQITRMATTREEIIDEYLQIKQVEEEVLCAYVRMYYIIAFFTSFTINFIWSQ